MLINTKTIKVIFMWIFLFLSIFTFRAIGCFFEIEKQIMLPPEFNNTTFIVIRVYGDTVYVLNSEIYKNENGYKYSLLFYVQNNNKKMDTLFYPDNIEFLKYNVENFEFINNYLYLFDSRGIRKFNKRGKNYIFNNYSILKNERNYFEKESENFIYFSNINYPPPYSDTAIVFVSIYDDKLMLIKSREFDEIPSAKYFTFFHPKHLIDVSGQKIAIADIDRYKIYFYNKDFKLIDTISRYPEKWIYGDSNYYKKFKQIIKKYGRYAKNIIAELRKEYYNISTLDEIYYINDSTLLAIWKQKRIGNDYIKYYDIWRYNNKKWILFKSNLQNSSNGISNNSATKKKLKWGRIDYLKDNYIYYISKLPFNIFSEKYSDLTNSEIMQEVRKYYINHENLRLSILCFKLILR